MLELLGIAENTIIVYSSDHGCALGEHGLWTKGFFYEESIRVPFIVSAPGLLPEGMRYEGVSGSINEGPTMLDLAGVSVPEVMDGESLFKDRQNPEGPEAIFSEFIRGGPGDIRNHRIFVRYQHYTLEVDLIHNGDLLLSFDHDPLLFDLEKDPAQNKSVYHEPEYDEIREKMTRLLQEWLEQAMLADNSWIKEVMADQFDYFVADFPEHVSRYFEFPLKKVTEDARVELWFQELSYEENKLMGTTQLADSPIQGNELSVTGVRVPYTENYQVLEYRIKLAGKGEPRPVKLSVVADNRSYSSSQAVSFTDDIVADGTWQTVTNELVDLQLTPFMKFRFELPEMPDTDFAIDYLKFKNSD